MPSAGSLVRSFLGDASVRIQNLLSLDALVHPRYDTEEKITPVVIVGDGERPGMGIVRGRRFAIMSTFTAGTFVADVLAPGGPDVQIDALIIGADGAGRCNIGHLSQADVTAFGALTAPLGRALDRNLSEERSPFIEVLSGAGSTTVMGVWLAVANTSIVIPFPFMLANGTGICCNSNNAAANGTITILGRTF